jgi:hypothetical protein
MPAAHSIHECPRRVLRRRLAEVFDGSDLASDTQQSAGGRRTNSVSIEELSGACAESADGPESQGSAPENVAKFSDLHSDLHLVLAQICSLPRGEWTITLRWRRKKTTRRSLHLAHPRGMA